MNINFRSNVWRVLTVSVFLMALVGVAMAQGPGPQGQVATVTGDVVGPQRAQASLGTAITYQGQLRNTSGPVNDTCDFQFSLWDAPGNGSPPTGGNQIGATQTKSGVSVSSGLFTIPDLDFGGSAFTGDARWLQVAVKCAGEANYTTLAPRQALTAAPYAISLMPDAMVTFHDSTGIALSAAKFASGGFAGLEGYGYYTNTYGVYGYVYGSQGIGVRGYAAAPSGYTYGVVGRTKSTEGIGVFGYADAYSGTTYGVAGRTDSISGTAIRGNATASSGATRGVVGRTDSIEGIGVQGYAAAITGTNYGVSGLSDSTDYGFGVYGRSKATNGYGVYGTAPTTGTVGIATGSGTTYGVYGRADSLLGRGRLWQWRHRRIWSRS
jgi:hypothetical protein